MKRIVLALVTATTLLAGAPPMMAGTDRPFSTTTEHGCEFFTGIVYDGDLTFYNRDMRFVTLNPEWKAKYRSARCVRYCKVFLYEQTNLQVFSSSFDAKPGLGDSFGKIKSAKIFCANDRNMMLEENKERKAAEQQRKALNNETRKKILVDEMKIRKLP